MDSYEVTSSVYLSGFGISLKICLIYRYLMKTPNDLVDEKVNKLLEDYLVIERNFYNRLDLGDVDTYLRKLSEINAMNKNTNRDVSFDENGMGTLVSYSDGGDFDNIQLNAFNRYEIKLHDRWDRLYGGQLLFGKFSVSSVVSGVININAFSLMDFKIRGMQATTMGDKAFLEKLMSAFNSFKFKSLSLCAFSEEYALKSRFDFTKIKPIDILTIPELRGRGCEALMFAKQAISDLVRFSKKENNVMTTLRNLYSISILEVVLSMLDINQLRDLMRFCNEKMVNTKDYQLQTGIIRRLLYKRKKELGF